METREEYLERAVEEIAAILGPYKLDASKETGQPMIDAVRVSVGYPLHPRTARRDCLGGECLAANLAIDKKHSIFIPPTIDDGGAAIGILIHQLAEKDYLRRVPVQLAQ